MKQLGFHFGAAEVRDLELAYIGGLFGLDLYTDPEAEMRIVRAKRPPSPERRKASR